MYTGQKLFRVMYRPISNFIGSFADVELVVRCVCCCGLYSAFVYVRGVVAPAPQKLMMRSVATTDVRLW